MSKPKNHHYVSQCHQKEFFDDKSGRIYLYDKELDNHYSKQSTKHLFSEDHLNSRLTEHGIDQESLEKELKVLFEDDFHKHVSQVKEFLVRQDEMQTAYDSLCWLTFLGILGELRHPYFKKELDGAILDMQSNIVNRFYDFPREEVKEHLRNKQVTPYNNDVSYIKIALKIFEKLEPLDFFIVSIESNDLFVLPDTSSFQRRGQLQKYPNPYINEIIQVGIPVTNKLYILATPQILKSEMHGIWHERNDDSDLIFQINKDMFSFSKKAVACSSEEYLRKFVDKIKGDT